MRKGSIQYVKQKSKHHLSNGAFALLLLSYKCIVTVYVLWLYLTVTWVSLQCVIVVFPDHTYFFYLVADF